MASPSYPHAVLNKLRTWGHLAIRLGLYAEFMRALREVEERLSADPEAWGDPQRDLRHLHLTVYHRYGPLLIVKYAVHIDGSPVFVLDVLLTPGTPLDYASR
jgi:hypothetical protein